MINRNQYFKIAYNTKKQENMKIYVKVTFRYPPALDAFPPFFQKPVKYNLSLQYKNPYIHWEIAIFTPPPPQPKKKKKPKIVINDKVTFH